MNNKGFTLVEMIVTIALLGLVGIVLSINMIKVINDQKEDKKAEVKVLLEEAACTYSIMKGIYSVTGATLVSEGLIDEVVNGYDVKDYQINITFDDGERICTLDGEVE